MKIFSVEFEGIYPVGSCLIIAARSKKGAMKIAEETVTHTDIESIEEIRIDEPKVIIYQDGNY